MFFEERSRGDEDAIWVVAGVAGEQRTHLRAGLAGEERLRGDEGLLDIVRILTKVRNAVSGGDGAQVLVVEVLLKVSEPGRARLDGDGAALKIGEGVDGRLGMD